MNDPNESKRLLRALLGHLRVLEQTHDLDIDVSVRLSAALAQERLAAARAAGVPEAALATLQREGQALVLDQVAAPEPESPASSTLPPASTLPPSSALPPSPPPSLPQAPSPSLPQAPPPIPAADDPFALFDQPMALVDEGPADLASAAEELAPVPSSSETELVAGGVRRFPRLALRVEVAVDVDGRDASLQMWTRDISSGGMFLSTAEPIANGTALLIQLTTSDGVLKLPGKVVHVVDGGSAWAAGKTHGLGVQFEPLEEEIQAQLGSYLVTVASAHEREAEAAAAGVDDAVAKRVRSFVKFCDSAKIYQALELLPQASDDEVSARVAELETRFTAAEAEAEPGFQAELAAAREILAGVSKMVGTTARRLAYDFAHGYFRAEERLAELEKSGGDTDMLRAVWHKVFPERLAKAQSQIKRAVAQAKRHDYSQACRLSRDAIALDPFNRVMRLKRRRWEVYDTIVRESRDDCLDVTERQAWAAERGVSEDQLRTLWRMAQPERFERAALLLRQATREKNDGRMEKAISTATEALRCDPFNARLRAALTQWQRASAASDLAPERSLQ